LCVVRVYACERVCVCLSVCARERERERAREGGRVGGRERERERVCVCVSVRESGRERERRRKGELLQEWRQFIKASAHARALIARAERSTLQHTSLRCRRMERKRTERRMRLTCAVASRLSLASSSSRRHTRRCFSSSHFTSCMSACPQSHASASGPRSSARDTCVVCVSTAAAPDFSRRARGGGRECEGEGGSARGEVQEGGGCWGRRKGVLVSNASVAHGDRFGSRKRR